MSHQTRVETPVEMKQGNEKEIKAAAREFGCTVKQNAKARGWRGAEYEADMVIIHPNSSYDLALNKTEDGKYNINADSDAIRRELYKIYGSREHPFGKLIQSYVRRVIRKEAVKKGYRIEEATSTSSNKKVMEVKVNG